MLVCLDMENFKSYKTPVSLDFHAADATEFSGSLLSMGQGVDILPVSVIYGAHTAGKSNVLQGLACLISTVVQPIEQLGKHRCPIILQQAIPCTPFWFDDVSRESPTEFRLFLRLGSREYRYYIALQNHHVISESLYWKPVTGSNIEMLFEREGADIALGADMQAYPMSKNTDPQMPYLSHIAIHHEVPAVREIQDWFESCITQSYATTDLLPEAYMLERTDIQREVLCVLHDLDIRIENYFYDPAHKQVS